MPSPLDPAVIKDIRRMRRARQSIPAIADALGVSRSAVQRAVCDMPLDLRSADPAWLGKAQAMAARGLNRHVIAQRLGVPLPTIYKAFRTRGIAAVDGRKPKPVSRMLK